MFTRGRIIPSEDICNEAMASRVYASCRDAPCIHLTVEGWPRSTNSLLSMHDEVSVCHESIHALGVVRARTRSVYIEV